MQKLETLCRTAARPARPARPELIFVWQITPLLPDFIWTDLDRDQNLEAPTSCCMVVYPSAKLLDAAARQVVVANAHGR